MATKGKLLGGFVLLIGGLIFLIILLVGGILAYRFIKYKNAGLDGLQTAPQTVVAITSPQTLSEASEGSPVPVDVSSNGYQPLASTELWVDEILMGVQAAPPNGPFNFNATFLWSPGPAGEHSLVARTLDANGDPMMSTPVLVNITEHEPAEAAGGPFDAGPAGVFPASSGGGGGNAPTGDGPGSNENESPGQVGLPTVGDWLVDITNTEPPLAPGLTATMDGCTISLHIHDLSNNEEGFQIFRSVLSAPAWTKIAELNSQSSAEWITYADELKGPTKVSYYVTAVNGAGVAQSNPAPVNLTSPGCAAPEGNQEILVIQPVGLHIDAAMDQAYCYRSMGGVHWERWPSDGFFLPGADGFDIQPYGMTLALKGLDGKPLIEKLDLYVECWGWAGSVLTYLGKVHFGSTDLIDLGVQSKGDGIFTMDLKFDIDFNIPNSDFKWFMAPPLSAEMPFIDAWVTYDPQVCAAHLDAGSDSQNPPSPGEAVSMCAPFPGYSAQPGAAHPQPYLVWEVMEGNACMAFSTGCQTVESLLEIAQSNGGSVFFNIYDKNNYLDHFTFSDADVTALIVPPSKCTGNRTFRVKLQYSDSSNFVEGPYSNSVIIPCDILTQAHLDVSFDSITFSNVDDDDGGPEDIEVYGIFQALSTDGSKGMLKMAQFGNFDNCPAEGGISLDSSGFSVNCPNTFSDGTWSLKDSWLCDAIGFHECSFSHLESQFDFHQNSNVVHITVGDGDSIVLQVMLIDWDTGSGNDAVCVGTIATSSNTVEGWINNPSSFGIGQNANGHAACNVQGIISASP